MGLQREISGAGSKGERAIFQVKNYGLYPNFNVKLLKGLKQKTEPIRFVGSGYDEDSGALTEALA